MTTMAGSRAPRAGRYFEGRCEIALLEAGYWVMRSPGSHGVVDVLGLKPGQVLLCQAKRGGRIAPAEWNALFYLAAELRAVPLLVDCPARGQVRFRRLLAPRREGDRSRLQLADFALDFAVNDPGRFT